MSALGQKQTYAVQKGISALPPIATSIAFSACPLRAKSGCRVCTLQFKKGREQQPKTLGLTHRKPYRTFPTNGAMRKTARGADARVIGRSDHDRACGPPRLFWP